VFPREDGGMHGPDRTRYVEAPDVTIEVPYDETGGAFGPDNRVIAAPRVYRAVANMD